MFYIIKNKVKEENKSIARHKNLKSTVKNSDSNFMSSLWHNHFKHYLK